MNFASCARPVSRALCITSLAPIIGQHHLGEGVKQLGGIFYYCLCLYSFSRKKKFQCVF